MSLKANTLGLFSVRYAKWGRAATRLAQIDRNPSFAKKVVTGACPTVPELYDSYIVLVVWASEVDAGRDGRPCFLGGSVPTFCYDCYS
jgi:hypothetical protein